MKQLQESKRLIPWVVVVVLSVTLSWQSHVQATRQEHALQQEVATRIHENCVQTQRHAEAWHATAQHIVDLTKNAPPDQRKGASDFAGFLNSLVGPAPKC